MSGAAIALEGVAVVRQGTTILDGVDWSLPEGAHCVLLGANGSGKTTLLKVVLGYEWATRGSVTVLGETLGRCHLQDLRKRIGWASSSLETRVPPFDSAEAVVLSGLEASLGLYRAFDDIDRAAAREALSHLNADYLVERPFGVLSQGERQRVMIARAIVHRPALLILDEPCAGLDPAARDRLLTDLGAMVSGHGAPTVVYVTHHIEETAPWMRAALVLAGGRVAASGTPRDVLTSACLSDAFDWPCVVGSENGRYWLRPA